VASLGWVSPGAATEGVNSHFFWKKLANFFSHHRLPVLRYHPLFSPEKNWLTFLLITVRHFYWFHLGCHPLEGVTRGGQLPPVTPLYRLVRTVTVWTFQGTCTVLWRLQLIDWQPPQFTVDDNPAAFHPDLFVRFADLNNQLQLQLL